MFSFFPYTFLKMSIIIYLMSATLQKYIKHTKNFKIKY